MLRSGNDARYASRRSTAWRSVMSRFASSTRSTPSSKRRLQVGQHGDCAAVLRPMLQVADPAAAVPQLGLDPRQRPGEDGLQEFVRLPPERLGGSEAVQLLGAAVPRSIVPSRRRTMIASWDRCTSLAWSRACSFAAASSSTFPRSSALIVSSSSLSDCSSSCEVCSSSLEDSAPHWWRSAPRRPPRAPRRRSAARRAWCAARPRSRSTAGGPPSMPLPPASAASTGPPCSTTRYGLASLPAAGRGRTIGRTSRVASPSSTRTRSRTTRRRLALASRRARRSSRRALPPSASRRFSVRGMAGQDVIADGGALKTAEQHERVQWAQLRVGIMVIVSLVVFAVGVFFISGQWDSSPGISP